MSLLSRFFGKRRRSRLQAESDELQYSTTPLEQVGARSGPERIMAVMRIDSDREFRLAAGLSTLVIGTAHKFDVGLRSFLAELPEALTRIEDSTIDGDSLLIEAVAYCHFVLWHTYGPDNWRYPDLSPREQAIELPAYVCSLALQFSRRQIERHHEPSKENYIMTKRFNSYKKAAQEVVDSSPSKMLVSAVVDLLDGDKRDSEVVPGLASTIGANGYVGIFHQTFLKALLESTDRLFDNADDILAEAKA